VLKVLSIFGTRPEAIKMASGVVKAREQHPADIVSRVCVTVPHREMLGLFDAHRGCRLTICPWCG